MPETANVSAGGAAVGRKRREPPSLKRSRFCIELRRTMFTLHHRVSRSSHASCLGALAGLLAVATACAPHGLPDAEPHATRPVVETRFQAIRNGQRDPRLTPMTSGQVLAIGYLHDTGARDSAFCTGTVIAPRLVVTAKHCTAGLTAADLGFGVGLTPAQAVADFAVASIVEHPDVDVALLVLARPAPLDAPGLVPLGFNREPLDSNDTGHEVEAAGFGETMDPTRDGRYFAVVLLSAIDDTYILVDGQLREGLCFGDSGGPVLDLGANGEPLVLGVEHGGEESCVGRDQLTRLDRVQAWIDGVAATLPPEAACGIENYEGHCEGDVAVWCHENGQLARLDCGAEGRICGFVDADTGYYCKSSDDCAGELTGCNGDVRIYCSSGVVAEEDCQAQGGACTHDAGGALCVDADGHPLAPPVTPPPPPPDLISGEALPETPAATVPEAPAAHASQAPTTARKSLEFRGGCQQAAGMDAPLGLLLLLGGAGRRRRRARRQG